MTDGSSRTERFLAVLAKMTGRGGARSERTERLLLGVALVVFVGAAGLAWRSLPVEIGRVRWEWLLAAVLLTILALALNAWEFRLSSRILLRPLGWWASLQVSTLGTAANLLPVPGAAAVRVRALRQGGHALSASLTVTMAIGVAWVSAAAVVAGLFALASGLVVFGTAALAAGLATGAGALWILRRGATSPGSGLLGELVVVEIVSVTLSGVRLYAVAAAFILPLGLSDSMGVNLGGILSHVAGVFPAGLGLRELLSGVFGALVGASAAVAVVVAAADRLVAYAVLAAVAAGISGKRRRGGASPAVDTVGTDGD